MEPYEFVPLDPEDVREREAIVANSTVCQICFKAFDKYRQNCVCPYKPVRTKIEQLISQRTLREQEKAREEKEDLILQILERAYPPKHQNRPVNVSNLEKSELKSEKETVAMNRFEDALKMGRPFPPRKKILTQDEFTAYRDTVKFALTQAAEIERGDKVVVPREPIGQQIMFGIHCLEKNEDLPNIGYGPKAVAIYKAMIAAIKGDHRND